MPQYTKGTIINHASAVRRASNKIEAFESFSLNDVPSPDYCTDIETATQWVAEGFTVYGRQTVTGSQGAGIIIFKEGDEVTLCPLYTKATKAGNEFRVHVMNGKVIDFVQKKKRLDFEGGIRDIRNHANGWVFTRNEVELPDKVREAALGAIEALGLDFGAVDIGYKSSDDCAFVYEVNTAPGLEGTTLARYVQAFKEEYING